VDLETAQAIAARWRPELAELPGRLHAGGRNVWALDVGEWVVRIPRRPQVVEQLVLETRLIDAIRPLLPVAVPRSRPVGVLDDGTPFFAHPRIAGAPIDDETAASGLVASALVGALHALHAVPPRQVTYLGAPVQDAAATRARLAATAQRIGEEVLPLLPGDAADDARREWTQILDVAAGWTFDPVVVHADLAAANVLVDRSRRVLTGVIDWKSLKVGDPAEDFAGLLTDLGGTVAADLLDLYADSADCAAALLRRAATYAQVEPYYEVLLGLDLDAPDQVRDGLATIAALAGRAVE
jgi:aminoglycoside phosphotransferase (APT) family kinase protein